MPGLVNIHTHPTTEPAYRGVREDHGVPEQQMSGLFERMQAFSWTRPGSAAAMRLAYAELMSAGVTSVVDLSPPFPGWIDIMRESGLRVWAGPGFASARMGHVGAADGDVAVEPTRTPARRLRRAPRR